MERPRIAVVGTGAWGLSHVRTFAAEPAADLTWICDREPAALARAARVAPQARATTELDEVLAARDVDGTVIATPAVTHAALAVTCLARGRHVLVEKPLAMSVREGEQIAEAAAKSGGAGVLVGHLMLYHPVVEHLRRLVAGGELGDVYYLSSVRANLGRLRRDENALWSFGPHDLSMIDYLVPGTPVSIAARGASFLQPGIADVVFVNLELAPASGGRPVMAQVHLSWLNPHKERRLMIVGARKMAELDDTGPETLRIYDRGYDRPPDFADFAEYLTLRNGDIYVPQIPMVEPLAAMARHFAACVAGSATPRTDLASGLRVVELLAAAQTSLERGGEPVTPGRSLR